MKEKKKRDSIAQDRSFQFSSHQSNSFISNSTIRQTSNKSPPSTWICSNCSYVNSKDATSCITCSHPRIQSVQNSMPRLSIQSSSSSSFSKEPSFATILNKRISFLISFMYRLERKPSKISWLSNAWPRTYIYHTYYST